MASTNLTDFQGFLAQKRDNGEAEILIYQSVGEYWDGITAKQFADQLKALGKVERLSIRINSPGGNAFDGNAIYNLLHQHKSMKTVYIDGLAASIASVIAMAGDRIMVADNALMMIHRAWGLAVGDVDEMLRYADMLRKMDDSIVATYRNRTGLGEERLREMMKAETWLTSEEAIENGFADELVDALPVAAVHYDRTKFRFRRTPEAAEEGGLPADIRRKLAHMQLSTRNLKAASGRKP